MGYVPPSHLIVLPKDVTIQQVGTYSDTLLALYAAYSTPQAVIRPYTPSSYADYRRGLYGAPPIDWMPFLSAAFLGSVIALIAAILWALL